MQAYFDAVVRDRELHQVGTELDDYGVMHIWDYLDILRDSRRQSSESDDDERSEYLEYTVPPEHISLVQSIL